MLLIETFFTSTEIVDSEADAACRQTTRFAKHEATSNAEVDSSQSKTFAFPIHSTRDIRNRVELVKMKILYVP